MENELKDHLDNLVELNREDRTGIFVHRSLVARVKGQRQRGEHLWQTYHRVLLAGLEALSRQEVA